MRLFASLREQFGTTKLERDFPEGTTVADVVASLRRESNGGLSDRLHVALNHRYAEPDAPLQEGDEVAVFPPVSGGQEKKRFWITREPLSLDEIAALVTAPERGAIVVFSGTVRGVTGDLETDHLEYEAYEEMAAEVLAQIGAEVQQRWPQILDVAIVHRVGRLEVCESSVLVAVAAAHRQGVFDACAYAIERLKQIAPIWKKEVGPEGDFWVEGPGEHGRPPLA
ncbi:MAG: molybdopterin converting factor subunit 1 [Caldilineae bacterium]|nr:MAG: molybdopterin converting factor subunit 1 [Caldilineae bacterium]